MMDSSSLLKSIGWYRVAIDIATAFVVFGLIGEYWKDIGPFARALRSRNWISACRKFGLLVFPLMVVGGVAGELWANLQVAALEGEWEEAQLPRVLTDKQMATIAGKMSPFKGHRVIIGSHPFNGPNSELANKILEALRTAETDVNINQAGLAAEMGVGGDRFSKSNPEAVPHGVAVRFTTGNDKGRKFARAFAAALNDEHLVASAIGGWRDEWVDWRMKQDGLSRNDKQFEPVFVVVGDKR